MKIYFVRHGKTEYNGSGRMTGQTDIPLTEEGIEQAEQAADTMPSEVTALYSSDLMRCKQTTEILNRKLNLPVTYDPRLRERDFGSLAGKYWKDLDSDGSTMARDVAQKYDYRPYGGESVEDVHSRVRAFLEEMKRSHPDGVIVAVTSAGIIRALHDVLNGQAPEIVHNSSFHEFEF